MERAATDAEPRSISLTPGRRGRHPAGGGLQPASPAADRRALSGRHPRADAVGADARRPRRHRVDPGGARRPLSQAWAPNPARPDAAGHHWFLGDGMVHGIAIGGGSGAVVPQPLDPLAPRRRGARAGRRRRGRGGAATTPSTPTWSRSAAAPSPWWKPAASPSSCPTAWRSSATTRSTARSTARSPGIRTATRSPASSTRSPMTAASGTRVRHVVVSPAGRVVRDVRDRGPAWPLHPRLRLHRAVRGRAGPAGHLLDAGRARRPRVSVPLEPGAPRPRRPAAARRRRRQHHLVRGRAVLRVPRRQRVRRRGRHGHARRHRLRDHVRLGRPRVGCARAGSSAGRSIRRLRRVDRRVDRPDAAGVSPHRRAPVRPAVPLRLHRVGAARRQPAA